MKGRISLKDFIHGVKQELLEASESAAGPAAFEMTEIELEAVFGLDAKAKAEGSFAFFVKVEGEASTSQSQSTIGFNPTEAATTSWSSGVSATGSYTQPMFIEAPGTSPSHGFPYVQHEPTIVLQSGVAGTPDGSPKREPSGSDA